MRITSGTTVAGYWHQITDEKLRDVRGHLLPERERVVCYTRGRTTHEAERNAAADLGRDADDLCAARVSTTRRVAGRFSAKG